MTALAKLPLKAIGHKRAIEMMRRDGTRLVRMCSDQAGGGSAHYVVPGGYVEPDVAEKIKQHPLVSANHDGLFPGHDQTWMMGQR